MPFAVEGFIRGPVGSGFEDPGRLFQAAQNAGMNIVLDTAAYLSVLHSFAALQWPGKLFLNLNAGSILGSTSAISDLRIAIERVGLHPSQIVLELTEHEPIPDGTSMLRRLDPLFDEGLTLSLDDAGAGFANMKAICELQPHFIKLDRYFVEDVAESMVKRSVIQNFINLASDIGSQLVAEGVEREHDARMVAQMGIKLMQGYLFGGPTVKPNLAPLAGRFWDAFV